MATQRRPSTTTCVPVLCKDVSAHPALSHAAESHRSFHKSREKRVLAVSVESPLQTYLPVLSFLMFLFFGWSTTKPTSSWALLWMRGCAPVCFAIYMSYAVLQAVKLSYGLPVSITFGAPLCCGIVYVFMFYTFSSLASLGNVLNEVFTNPALKKTKNHIVLIERAIWTIIFIFELAAFYSSISQLLVPTSNVLIRLDGVLFLMVIPMIGFGFVALVACYHIVISLHWAQSELLAFHWRRRSSTPLLLTDSYFTPKLSVWQAAFLNFVSFSDNDPVIASMRPVLPVDAQVNEDLPLSTIVAQFMVVRRSVSSSISAWQFAVMLMLYVSWFYTLLFSYWMLVLNKSDGVPFTLLQPIVNALLLLPLAQLNSNWITLSKSQLDYNTARYTTEEQMLLLQLQMKQSLSFTLYGAPITHGIHILVQHVFIIIAGANMVAWFLPAKTN